MKKKISIILFIFLVIMMLTIKSNAGYVSNDPTATSGGNVTIIVSSSENLQNYDLKLVSYTGLTYVNCSSNSDSAAVNSTTGQISYATLGNGTKSLGTYTFTTPNVTEKTTYKVVFDINGTKNTSTVTVNPKPAETKPEEKPNSGETSTSNPTTPTTPTVKEKSNVATLSDLGIIPNDFKGFKSNTFSYNVEVPNEVEKIEIYAKSPKSEEGKQKISGHGANKSLKVGENKFEIKVTAEDGKTTKTYTINVTRAEKVEEKEPDEEIPEENAEEDPMEEIFGLSELKIEGIELEPQFRTDVYEYKVNIEDLEKLKLVTVATEADSNIEILGNENFVEGENIVTIHVKSEDEQKNATYQITVNKITSKVEEIENVTNEVTDIVQEPNPEQNNKNRIVIVSIAVLVIIAIIIISVVIGSKKNSSFADERYVTYGDLPNEEEREDLYSGYDVSFKQEKTNNEYEDSFEEQPIKRKKSKGKRFK